MVEGGVLNPLYHRGWFEKSSEKISKEKEERATGRERKEANILPPEELNKILVLPFVKAVLEQVKKSLEDESLPCFTAKDFIQLRNGLMTSLMICSLERAQEFSEFTLGEWKDIKPLSRQGDQANKEQEYVLKVKKCKTVQYGRAELILNETKKRALQAYVLYARPCVTDCRKDSCPAFISWMKATPSECCIKLLLSNMTKCV